MIIFRNVLSTTAIVTTLMFSLLCAAAIHRIDNQTQQELQLFVGEDSYTYEGYGEESTNIFLYDERLNENECIYSDTSHSVESGWTFIEITKRICTGDYLLPGEEGETIIKEHYKARARTITHKENERTVNELSRGDLVERL